MSTLDAVAQVDQLYVKQRFALVGNSYDISLVGADGKTPGERVCFVKQKRMKIREEINFFSAADEKEVVLQLKKKNVFEFKGRTDVRLPDGTVIGQLQKVFGRSLFRSTWEILDVGGSVVATAQEKSMALALLRRFGDMIPYVGFIFEYFPFHFDIAIGDRQVGTYSRPATGITDRYILDLSADTERRIDRRVALAFTVALDALQDR